MRRILLVLALVLFAARLVLQLAGLDQHASMVAGMPVDASSAFWGPCTILVQLACTLVAPVLVLALLLDVLVRAGSRMMRRPRATKQTTLSSMTPRGLHE